MVCFLLESPLAAAVGAMLYTKLFFIFMISACQCAAVVRSWIEPHREGDSGRIRYTCRPSSQSVVHPTLTYPTSLNFMRNDFFPLSRAPQLIFDFSGHPCVNPDPRNRRRVWRHDQRNGAHGGERNRFPLFYVRNDCSAHCVLDPLSRSLHAHWPRWPRWPSPTGDPWVKASAQLS